MKKNKDSTGVVRARAGSHPPGSKRLKRLTAVIAGLCLLGIAAGFGHLVGQRIAIHALEEVAAHRLDVFRASFFSPIERYEYLPNLLAAHPVIIDTLLHKDDKPAQAALNDFLQQVNATTKSAAVYVMDQNGLTIASSNWNTADSFVGKNFSFRPYFQEALTHATGRFYGVGAVTGVPGYFLAYPVELQKNVIGVVAVKIDLDNLDLRWESGADQIIVTDDSGVIFLSSNKEWKYRTTKPLSRDVLHRLRETRQYATMLKTPITFTPDPIWRYENVVRARNAAGAETARRYLKASHLLPQAKWTITTYFSMAQAERTAAVYAFVTAGGMAFMLLLAMYMLQVKHRMAEKQAAKKAADIAHEKLEAKHKELEILSRHLKTMANSDPLTGCHNRRYFTEIAGKVVSAARRHRRNMSILMLDIDFFKNVNDTWGHPAGDDVLKAVANACQAILRQPDFLVRFGGEEFMALLPDTGMDEAAMVAERLRSAIEQLKVPVSDVQITVTVSIGLSEFRQEETALDKTINRADIALYHAKRNGRNRTVPYAYEMDAAETAEASDVM